MGFIPVAFEEVAVGLIISGPILKGFFDFSFSGYSAGRVKKHENCICISNGSFGKVGLLIVSKSGKDLVVHGFSILNPKEALHYEF